MRSVGGDPGSVRKAPQGSRMHASSSTWRASATLPRMRLVSHHVAAMAQGLTSGFEVGPKLQSPDELRKEWEEFKRKRQQEQEESSVIPKGLYQVGRGAERRWVFPSPAGSGTAWCGDGGSGWCQVGRKRWPLIRG